MAKSDVEIVYLDTNVLIEAVEDPKIRGVAMVTLLALAEEADRLHLFTSRVSLAEVLVKPARREDDSLMAAYVDLFNGARMSVREVDADTLFHASLLRADNRRLKLFDAIHIATAQAASAGMIVTRDTAFAGVCPGPACARFARAATVPPVCTPDSPVFAALLERHAA